MKVIFCSAFMMLVHLWAFPQSAWPSVSLPSVGISAYGAVPDGFSFQSNVACLAQYGDEEISLFSERRFMLAELQFFSAAAVWKMASGKFGLIADHHSFNGYRNSGIGAAYSRELGNVSIGLMFSYSSQHDPEISSSSTFAAHSGMLVSITPRLKFGWQINNFPATRSGNLGRLLPFFRGGLGYMASKECLLGFEVLKQEGFPVNIHAGFSYNYRRRFFIRGGIQSATGSFYAGGGWMIKKLQLHLYVSHHPYLGFSPGILLNNKF